MHPRTSRRRSVPMSMGTPCDVSRQPTYITPALSDLDHLLLATDPPGIYKVLTSRTHNLSQPLPPGTVFRVNTGGPLPAGTDAVIMVEDTRLYSTQKSPTGDEVEENEVETLVQIPRGENVREPGSDVRQGELVLERGTVVNSAGGEVGTLAFVGRATVCGLSL